MLTIAVIGTLDTKGAEHAFLVEQIRLAGHRSILIDVGTQTPPKIQPDVSREEVLGTSQLAGSDRGQAIAWMSSALPDFLRRLHARQPLDGVLALGGCGGTAIATAGMRALPLGIPKVMVSTMTSGNIAPYVGVSDIVMMPSIVDVSGLNRISMNVFERAAAAVMAMAQANRNSQSGSSTRPLIVASMFGNTTKCIDQARAILEAEGFEVLVFHATGVGGRAMEAIIDAGMVSGVLDVTTTEWADELVGGVLAAGPDRLSAAARMGVPAIVAPGCLDMVNFGEPASIPERFRDRLFYAHNPQVTLMRTTAGECSKLGQIIAEKLNASKGPVRFMYPLRGISLLSRADGPFHDASADRALHDALRATLRSDIVFEELDSEINDARFAEACAHRLLELIRSRPNR